MKYYFLLLTLTILLSGCNPFASRQNQTKQKLSSADAVGEKINQSYKADIRKIHPYKVYRYKNDLSDPFKTKKFLIQDESIEKNTPFIKQSQCLPPQCMPPEPHKKSLLENYALEALAFVGTLSNKDKVGLIETPDYGIVQVKVGDYIGENNGKIININESAIILQEKFLTGGRWENKKTILVIR